MRAIASKDEQAIRAFDQDTLSFANYTLRRDPEIRFDIFIPDTPWEKTLDWAKTGIDIFYPTPTGKTGAAVKATEKVSAEVLAKLGEKFGDDLAKQVPKGTSLSGELTSISQRQLDKKFKHAADFGVTTTKKNPDTLGQFGAAIESHMSAPSTISHGTYGFVKDSKVFFNSETNNAVVLDGGGGFVTGFKLSPGTPQFEYYIKNGILR